MKLGMFSEEILFTQHPHLFLCRWKQDFMLCANREEHIKQRNTTQAQKYQERLQAEALLQG